MPTRNVADAFSICAVDDDQKFAVGWNYRGNHGFDAERSRSLHQYRLVAFRLPDAGKGQQELPDFDDDGNEISVPRSHVAQHRLLDGIASRERPGSEEELVCWGCHEIRSKWDLDYGWGCCREEMHSQPCQH